MLKNLPKLKVIKIEDLIYHERYDSNRVDRLAENLNQQKIQKNPIIVTKLGNKLLILDGVTRTTALKKLRYKYVLAQVVDYNSEDILLSSWNHLIFNNQFDPFFFKIKQIKGLEIKKTSELQAESLLKNKDIIGYLILENKDVFALHCNTQTDYGITYLNKIVNLYNKLEIYRTDSKEIKTLIGKHGGLAAIFVMPTYSKKEIIDVASRNMLIPCGITKHVIPNRVLRLNFDLHFLKGNLPLEKINKYLNSEIKRRLDCKQIRAYSETVFVFDE